MEDTNPIDIEAYQDPEFRTIEILEEKTQTLETICFHGKEGINQHGRSQKYPEQVATIINSKCEYFVQIFPQTKLKGKIKIQKPHYVLARNNYPSLKGEVHCKSLSLRECLQLMIQIAKGVHYLHTELKILHCELVLKNILLDQNKSIKINGFHNARKIQKTRQSARLHHIWMAPEVTRINEYYQNYSVESEIWSLGLMFNQLMQQRILLKQYFNKQTMEYLQQEPNKTEKTLQKLSLPVQYGPIKDLIDEMLRQSSSKRPSLEVVISQLQKQLDILNYYKPETIAKDNEEMYQQSIKYKNDIYKLFPHFIDPTKEQNLSKLKSAYIKLVQGRHDYPDKLNFIQRNCIEFVRQKIIKQQWLRAWKIIQEIEILHQGQIRPAEKQSLTLFKALCCDQEEVKIVPQQKKQALSYFEQYYQMFQEESKEFDDRNMLFYTKKARILHEQAIQLRKNDKQSQMQKKLMEAEVMHKEALSTIEKKLKSKDVSLYKAEIKRQYAESLFEMKRNKEAASFINESLSQYRKIFSDNSSLKNDDRYSELFEKCIKTTLQVLKRHGVKDEISEIRRNCAALFPHNKYLLLFIDKCKERGQ